MCLEYRGGCEDVKREIMIDGKVYLYYIYRVSLEYRGVEEDNQHGYRRTASIYPGEPGG